MFSKLWRWLTIAAGAVAGVFYLLFRLRTGQRDHAREEAGRQEQRAEVQDRTRQREGDMRQAQHRAREDNAEARQNREKDPDSRTGRFGTADRLRNDD